MNTQAPDFAAVQRRIATAAVAVPPEMERAARRLDLQRKALNSFFGAMAGLADLSSDLRRARNSVDVLRDVPYGPHAVANLLDVYRPRYAAWPMPVLLYIHGGAFVLCSKETHASIALLNAARAGYLVFNINYRLAPRHPYPAAVEDACDAYRWVVQNAARFGGDARRIVVAGESAGGNLALGVTLAATTPRPEPWARAVYDLHHLPQAVMPLMPYLQASEPMARFGKPGVSRWSLSIVHDIARAYLGEQTRCCAENELADPIRVLEACRPQRPFPRVFSGVGTADLCCEDVQRLEAACAAHGIEVAAHYWENELHAFHALRWRAAAREFWDRSIDFLRETAARPLPVAAEEPVATAAISEPRFAGARRALHRVAHWSRQRSQSAAGIAAAAR